MAPKVCPLQFFFNNMLSGFPTLGGIPLTNLPLTPQVRHGNKPAFSEQNTNFQEVKALVIISDPLSSVWIFFNENIFISKASRIQWYRTSMCFDLEWNAEFLLR